MNEGKITQTVNRAIEKAITGPRYCYEYLCASDDRLKCIENQFLSAYEVAYVLYGKIMELSEARLVEIAQKTGAMVLWKSPSLFEHSVTCIYEHKGPIN